MAFILKALLECLLHVRPWAGSWGNRGANRPFPRCPASQWIAGERTRKAHKKVKVMKHIQGSERGHYEHRGERPHLTWRSEMVPRADLKWWVGGSNGKRYSRERSVSKHQLSTFCVAATVLGTLATKTIRRWGWPVSRVDKGIEYQVLLTQLIRRRTHTGTFKDSWAAKKYIHPLGIYPPETLTRWVFWKGVHGRSIHHGEKLGNNPSVQQQRNC